MPDEELIERVRQRARANFTRGYNCSESVFEALAGELNLGLPAGAFGLASGFGGGIGLYGDTCGAICGAVVAIGAVHGRRSLPQGEGREVAEKSKQQFYGRPGVYRIFNQVPNRIAEKYGATLCRELTREWHGNWLCRDHARSCREIITDAAGIAAELMLSGRDEVACAPFGSNVEGLSE